MEGLEPKTGAATAAAAGVALEDDAVPNENEGAVVDDDAVDTSELVFGRPKANEGELDVVVVAAVVDDSEVDFTAPNVTAEVIDDSAKVVAAAAVVAAAPKTNPPLGLGVSDVEVGAPKLNVELEVVEDEAAGAPNVKEDAAGLSLGTPNLKEEPESAGLPPEPAGAPKVKLDEDELEEAPPRLNPPEDMAPGMIFGPEDAGVMAADVAALPGFGLSQQTHFSLPPSFCTMHVSQVHFAAGAVEAAGAPDPGFGVSQQTHLTLSVSF